MKDIEIKLCLEKPQTGGKKVNIKCQEGFACTNRKQRSTTKTATNI